MKKYENKVIFGYVGQEAEREATQKLLDSLGKDGWKLVSTTGNDYCTKTVMFLRREIV